MTQDTNQDMTLDDFAAWIVEDVSVVRQRSGAQDANAEELALAQSLKLVEEAGELADQVLGHYGFQRVGKAHKFSEREMALEVADVFITTWELVHLAGGDLGATIRECFGFAPADGSVTMRQVESAMEKDGYVRPGTPRLVALRRASRLSKDCGTLHGAISSHYERTVERGMDADGMTPWGILTPAVDVLSAAISVGFAVGIDPMGSVLEKRHIIRGRGSRGDG